MKTTLFVCALFAAFALAVSLVFWSQVPDPMPIHWNASGHPDGYASRTFGLLLCPALALGVPALVCLIAMADPRARKHQAWTTLLIGISGYIVVVHGLIIRAAIAPDQKLSIRALTAAIACLIGLIGLVLPLIKPNRIAGIRTPWTLADDRNWTLTHRFGGWTVRVAAIVAAAAAFVVPDVAVLWVALGGAAVGFVAPVLFSWALHKARPLS